MKNSICGNCGSDNIVTEKDSNFCAECNYAVKKRGSLVNDKYEFTPSSDNLEVVVIILIIFCALALVFYWLIMNYPLIASIIVGLIFMIIPAYYLLFHFLSKIIIAPDYLLIKDLNTVTTIQWKNIDSIIFENTDPENSDYFLVIQTNRLFDSFSFDSYEAQYYEIYNEMVQKQEEFNFKIVFKDQ